MKKSPFRIKFILQRTDDLKWLTDLIHKIFFLKMAFSVISNQSLLLRLTEILTNLPRFINIQTKLFFFKNNGFERATVS